MDIKDFLLGNYETLFDLIGLIVTLLISVHISKKVKRLVLLTDIFIIIAGLIYYFERYLSSFESRTGIRVFLSSIQYVMYPLIQLFLIFILMTIRKPITIKQSLLLSSLLIISIPIILTSQWTHIIFYISEDNEFVEGYVYRYPYFLFGIYLIIFIVLNIKYLKDYSVRNRYILIYIACASFLGVLLYLIFDYSVFYLPIYTSAIVFYFLFLYIHLAGIDPLTGLVNRQCYYQDMDSKSNVINYVLSIDMNDLKYYNDTYGHDAGDNALKTIASIIQDNRGSRSTAYRIGGDEFIVFYYGITEEDIITNIKNIREALEKTPYSCAIGYAFKEKNVSVEDTIKIADRYMYDEKAIMKASIVNSHR